MAISYRTWPTRVKLMVPPGPATPTLDVRARRMARLRIRSLHNVVHLRFLRKKQTTDSTISRSCKTLSVPCRVRLRAKCRSPVAHPTPAAVSTAGTSTRRWMKIRGRSGAQKRHRLFQRTRPIGSAQCMDQCPSERGEHAWRGTDLSMRHACEIQNPARSDADVHLLYACANCARVFRQPAHRHDIQ
jgi:hypothetical protein